MSGAKAVLNGLNLESKVYSIFKIIPNVKIIKSIPYPSVYSLFGNPIFTHKTKMEFRVENIKLTYPYLTKNGIIHKTKIFNSVNVECKYQETSGSIDEKYPLVFSNSIISDAESTLMIYDDPNTSIKAGALNYVKELALLSNGRFIVMSLDDFISSVNNVYTRNNVRKNGGSAVNFMSFMTSFEQGSSNEELLISIVEHDLVDFEMNESDSRGKFINAYKYDSFRRLYSDYQNKQSEVFHQHVLMGNNVYDLDNLFSSLREYRCFLLKEIALINRDLFD